VTGALQFFYYNGRDLRAWGKISIFIFFHSWRIAIVVEESRAWRTRY